MGKKIKAIQTKYKGYNFRSRLEARWAVAMDHDGIEWEYEVEGFEVPGVGKYLPDFYLPKCMKFIEIKPKNGSENRWVISNNIESMPKEQRIVAAFEAQPCTGGGRSSLVLLYGDPLDHVIRSAHNAKGNYRWSRITIEAGEAARSARFEFGETPEIP